MRRPASLPTRPRASRPSALAHNRGAARAPGYRIDRFVGRPVPSLVRAVKRAEGSYGNLATMRHGLTSAFAALRVPATALSLLALAACAEGGETPDSYDDEDAGISWSSDGSSPYPSYDGSQSLPDPGFSSKPDGGSAGFIGLDGLFGGNGADGGAGSPPVSGDAGENAEGWTLNADSAKECPAVPPPIPIVGGICVGVYFGCGWTNAAGQQYSCICDWIHWLCI